MTDMKLVVDCETGDVRIEPLTEADLALRTSAADAQAAAQARQADQAAAREQLAAAAATNPDLALIAKAMGIGLPS